MPLSLPSRHGAGVRPVRATAAVNAEGLLEDSGCSPEGLGAPTCVSWSVTLGPLLSCHTPQALFRAEFGQCFGPFLSQAPEANTGSTASVRPAQEEQSTTPPGKVVTVSTRSPRCPRNQAALRHGKTFSPSSTPCSSGEAQTATGSLLGPCWALRAAQSRELWAA